MDYRNSVVVITGAGKGLGRAYAQHFAALGASVVVNNRRHEGETRASADRVVDEIVTAGGRAVADYSSVEKPGAGERLLAAAISNFGRLDCLIANAGISENGTFHKQTLAELREVLDINLFGTVNVAHPLFRHLYRQRRGSIVISTSTAGLFGQHGLPAYSMAKAALIGMMRSLSLEGASRNVTVNAIAPYAATQMTAAHLSAEANRQLGPELVAPAVAWLASGAVSGELLIAGGGRLARAEMRTTAAVPAIEIDGEVWQRLASLPAERGFPSAHDNFEDFVAFLETGGETA